VGRYVPTLKVVQGGEESDGGTAGFRLLIDEIVRDGARKMLAAAVQAEVAAYVKQFADQVDEDGRRLAVRNGYHQPRMVVTSAGAVEVKAPRVNDKRTDPETGERQRFSSAILPAWARRSPQITEVCHCCTCTACPQATSLRRSSSSSAQARACRHHRSPG
jgi:hypothetical protein